MFPFLPFLILDLIFLLWGNIAYNNFQEEDRFMSFCFSRIFFLLLSYFIVSFYFGLSIFLKIFFFGLSIFLNMFWKNIYSIVLSIPVLLIKTPGEAFCVCLYSSEVNQVHWTSVFIQAVLQWVGIESDHHSSQEYLFLSLLHSMISYWFFEIGHIRSTYPTHTRQH